MELINKLFGKSRNFDDEYLKLRNLALSMHPEQVGLTPDPSNPVYGVLVETGYADSVSTLSAMGDGSISLYSSRGESTTGLEQDELARKVCLSLISSAKQYISQLQPASEYPYPSPGYVSFYFLTLQGVLSATAKEQDLEKRDHPLSPLYHQVKEMITQARLADEKRHNEIGVLFDAARMGDVNTMKTLIANGANINMTDQHGFTALMVASYSGEVEIVRLLLEAGALVDQRDLSGYTALMYFCSAGNVPCVRLLLEHGASVNVSNHDCSTPLMFAAQQGHNEMVRLLLENGADPNTTDCFGLSAVDLAKKTGFTKTVKILQGQKE